VALIGVSVGATAGAGGVGADYNYAVNRVYDSQGNSGWAITLTGAAGFNIGVGGFAGVDVGFSSASTIYDLNGWNRVSSGSITAMPWAAGGDFFQGQTEGGDDDSYTWVFPD
jgi:hypothetical protein